MKLLAVVFCSLFAWQAIAAYKVSYQGEGSWVREEVEDAEGDVNSQLVLRLWGGGDSGGMDIELTASFGSPHVKDLNLKMEVIMQDDSCKVSIPGKWWGVPRKEGKCSPSDDGSINVSFTKDNRVIDIDMKFKKGGRMTVSGSIERADKCDDYCFILWGSKLQKLLK